MNKTSILTRIRRRLRDRKGQSTTEYILILAIVVMIATKMKKQLVTTVEGTLGTVNNQLQDFSNP